MLITAAKASGGPTWKKSAVRPGWTGLLKKRSKNGLNGTHVAKDTIVRVKTKTLRRDAASPLVGSGILDGRGPVLLVVLWTPGTPYWVTWAGRGVEPKSRISPPRVVA